MSALIDKVDRTLPQTQCTKCGFNGCRPYAEAIVLQGAAINRCPPGGAEGIARLSDVMQRPIQPLDTSCGAERRRSIAVIDEAACIGCTLCIQACPVDAIMGAPKQMHSVFDSLCTGCDLCVAPCPVDCISMAPVESIATGWAAWSAQQAEDAKLRYVHRGQRLQQEAQEQTERMAAKAAAKLAELTTVDDGDTLSNDAVEQNRKKAILKAALERHRAALTGAKPPKNSS